MKDPARAALEQVLSLTLEEGRFPREVYARRKLRGRHDVLDRLIADERYLVRVVFVLSDGSRCVKLALTVRGIYETETKQGRSEEQGLARTHDRLARATRDGVFRGGVKIEALHAAIGAGIELADFRRWCTMLCSPRLQGRHAWDPVGFCGFTDAKGVPDAKTGFFTELYVMSSFLHWPRLPDREPARAFLLSEDGLRVEVDARGQVHVQLGTAELRVLPASMPPRVFAALVANPRQSLHSLDLQAHADGCALIDDRVEFDAHDAAQRLRDLGIDVEVDAWQPEDVDRLAAVLRRIDSLETLATRAGPLPKFAQVPEARRKAAVEELKAALARGPLKAEWPLIKNATRVVSRGLGELLQDQELAAFRHCFTLGEWIAYRPTS